MSSGRISNEDFYNFVIENKIKKQLKIACIGSPKAGSTKQEVWSLSQSFFSVECFLIHSCPMLLIW